MANIKSQKKRNITNAKRAARNKAIKSELKTRVKTATSSVGTESHDEDVRLAVKRLDMAAAKGVIHQNQAARRKSRLMKQANSSGRQTIECDASERGRGLPARHQARHSDQRRRRDRRATSTSITMSSGRSLAPRRSRSAAASSSMARCTPLPPRRRYCCIALRAG